MKLLELSFSQTSASTVGYRIKNDEREVVKEFIDKGELKVLVIVIDECDKFVSELLIQGVSWEVLMNDSGELKAVVTNKLHSVIVATESFIVKAHVVVVI